MGIAANAGDGWAGGGGAVRTYVARFLNLLGRYGFTVSPPASGAPRPLRGPAALELDECDDVGGGGQE
ncbi:hypothetical protein [Streptomyces sp. NPDC102282]|uniref:hypothetical protein n=1 Tax=Streptomyces sp. NPDC102282 TaxID=3366154 RepID=UPI00380B7F2B